MKKLCYVATIPAVVHAFLRAHIKAAGNKYDITIICNASDMQLIDDISVRFIKLDIERKPSPLKDIYILYSLFALFRREKFDIVHSIMPKAGALAMFAAWLARVPIRIHTFTGQVWATKRGLHRALLKCFDKLIVALSVCILADSHSQREFLISEKVACRGKIIVIGSGSICGIDPHRFRYDLHERNLVRQELGIKQDSKLILYVGRLNRDKGIADLAAAFKLIALQNVNVELLLVGSEEDILFSQIQEMCSEVRDRLHYVTFSSKPERYMASADIFCLPSYREGFGMTIIEAAACNVPAVASRIYGITDAVEDGKTGLLFPAGDVSALSQALMRLITENDLLQQMGTAAYKRAIELFSSEKISLEMLSLYDDLVLKTR